MRLLISFIIYHMNIIKLKFYCRDITKSITSLCKHKFSSNTERVTDHTIKEQSFSNTKKEKKVDWSMLFKEDFSFEIKNFKENHFCNKPKAVVFDLNNVLLTYEKKKIAPYTSTLKAILKHPEWNSYLKASTTRDVAYEKIASDLKISIEQLSEVLGVARDCLSPIKEGVEILEKLKEKGYTLICLSNCPRDEIVLLQRRFDFLGNFDLILSSGDLGHNKPEKEAFYSLMSYTNLSADEIIFVDDDIENIASAESIGIKGLNIKDSSSYSKVFDFLNIATKSEKATEISPYSKKYFKAYNYLTKLADTDHHGFYKGIVGVGPKLKNSKLSSTEIFATVSVLTLSKQIALSPYGANILKELTKLQKNGKFKFFVDLEVIPYDQDTTSVCCALLLRHNMIDISVVNKVIDEMFTNVSDEGLFLTYFDKHRIRFCPIVCVNILYLIHLTGREKGSPAVEKTKKYLFNLLNSSEYSIDGTTYYPNPELFLLTLSKLVYKFPVAFAEFIPIMKREVQNRIGKNTDDSISLGVRSILSVLYDIENKKEFEMLLDMQLEDGSWKETAIYSTSSAAREDQFCWATRAYNTILGMKAIELQMLGKKSFNI